MSRGTSEQASATNLLYGTRKLRVNRFPQVSQISQGRLFDHLSMVLYRTMLANPEIPSEPVNDKMVEIIIPLQDTGALHLTPRRFGESYGLDLSLTTGHNPDHFAKLVLSPGNKTLGQPYGTGILDTYARGLFAELRRMGFDFIDTKSNSEGIDQLRPFFARVELSAGDNRDNTRQDQLHEAERVIDSYLRRTRPQVPSWRLLKEQLVDSDNILETMLADKRGRQALTAYPARIRLYL